MTAWFQGFFCARMRLAILHHMAKKRSRNQIPSKRGKTVQVYRGHYTADEYATVKQAMTEKYVDGIYVKKSHIEDIMRYVAKKNWPKERRGAWLKAKAQGVVVLAGDFLRMCDMAQAMLDSVRYGPEWVRFYEDVPDVPEAEITYNAVAVLEAIEAGKTLGEVPQIHKNTILDEVSDARV